MKVIADDRQTGKTTELIKMSAETGFYIVCHSRREAGRVFRVAIESDLVIPFPKTHREFLAHQYYSPGIKGFLIDNLDLLVLSLTDVLVEAVTITVEQGPHIPTREPSNSLAESRRSPA